MLVLRAGPLGADLTASVGPARIEQTARGWTWQYRERWLVASRAAGFTADEIDAADQLEQARREAYSILCYRRGAPCFGGGGYSNQDTDAEIIAIGSHPSASGFWTRAAEIVRGMAAAGDAAVEEVA